MIANPNDGNSPRVEVATPTISVSSGGLITAKTEQEKGYVPGGTKSATQQLTTQGAATITPGTTAQTAVASGRYTTGDVQVAGDANLVPENIAEGVSIFGVDGTHSGGGATATLTIELPLQAGYMYYHMYIIVDGQLLDLRTDVSWPGSIQIQVPTLLVVQIERSSGSPYITGACEELSWTHSPASATSDWVTAFILTGDATLQY